MKCMCGAWSEVKATRGQKRRRECANGHRFNTVEVREHDSRAIGKRMAMLERGRKLGPAATRTPLPTLRRIQQMLAEGATYAAVTAELGVSTKTIARWRDVDLAANEPVANRAAHG